MRANPSPETRLRALNLSRAKHQQHEKHDEHQHRQRTHQRKDKETGHGFRGYLLFRYRIGAPCRLSRRAARARASWRSFPKTPCTTEFGAREVGHRLLDVCKNNFHAIEPAAIARYRADPRSPWSR
jgi:hypothetical protein